MKFKQKNPEHLWGCTFANGADQTLKAKLNWVPIIECQDGYAYTAPMGRFRPNAWGLYDMLGNVWEWTCSEYDKDYGGSEQRCLSKGAAGLCVLRGGSWFDGPWWVRGAARFPGTPPDGSDNSGFRLVRTFP